MREKVLSKHAREQNGSRRNDFVAEKINSDGVSLFDDEVTGDNKAKLRVVAMFCKSVNKHSFFSFCLLLHENKRKKHGKKNHVDSGDYAEAFYREVY